MQRYIYYLTMIFCILFVSACYEPDYTLEQTIIPPLDEQISSCDGIINVAAAGSGSNTEGMYTMGDIITSEHLLKEFNYCYPSNSLGSSFSFSDHPNKVFMIEMSASW